MVRFLTDDPQLEISSRTLSLEKSEESQGFVSYLAPALAKSAVLAVNFSGGNQAAVDEEKPLDPEHGIPFFPVHVAKEGVVAVLLLAVAPLLKKMMHGAH